jgi:dTDP-4-amino-4,6-dideoxygalactose transaminase
MTKPLIRLSKSCLSNEETLAVNRVLSSEYLGMGVVVEEFEAELKSYLESNVACVNTGTSAIHLALQAVGCGPGDEVLVPSLTYLATYQAISATGATPISCDVDRDTGFLCLADSARKITSKTKALVPVLYGGATHNLKEYLEFATTHRVKCIFDAAHAFGSKFEGQLVGQGRGIYCFSFDGIKNITCGEGGCVVSDDLEVITAVNTARQLGISDEHLAKYANERLWAFDVESQGWRYHMSNINAAIGLAQLKRFSDLTYKRQQVAKFYDLCLQNTKLVTRFQNNYDEIVPHIYVVIIPGLINRDQLRIDLKDLGIETGVHYFPNHFLKLYKRDGLKLPNVESLFLEILTLPIHPDIKEGDVRLVVDSLLDLLQRETYFI